MTFQLVSNEELQQAARNYGSLEPGIVCHQHEIYYMFCNCQSFNQPLHLWDTSFVKNMSGMFCNCQLFDQLLHTWNTSSVTNLFNKCTSFNQPLHMWDTSFVTKMMHNMFWNCTSFHH